MAADRSRNRGFSLTEVLVVLVILGVLLAVLSSRLGNSYMSAVVSVTDQVEATLYAAQRTATTSLSLVTLDEPTPAMQAVIDAARRLAGQAM